MDKEKIVIYTDGSSLGNPGSGGWGAVVALPEGKIVELGGGEKRTTNNRMEMSAAIAALKQVADKSEEIIFYTDSSYTINGITKWVEGWVAQDWVKRDKTPVLNRDLWEELSALTKGKTIRWRHVAGHSGRSGNERADEIATGFAEGKTARLYMGARDAYPINVFDVSYDEAKKCARTASRARAKVKAYSYVSLVDGAFARHTTWAECEARVKGKVGAKYRKTLSAEDEARIKKEWGV